MAWFDPADWFLGDNPVYRRGLAPVRSSALPPLRSLMTCVGLAPALLCILLLVDLAWKLGLLFLTLAWLAPAIAASVLASEREHDTWEMLLLTPYPRRRILLGLLAARLRWWNAACFWSLPYLGLSVFLEFSWEERSGIRLPGPSGQLPFNAAFWAGVLWLLLVCAYLLAVFVGLWMAARCRSAIAAIASTYGILLLLYGISACIRGLPLLIFFIAGPHLCLDAAEASLDPSTLDD